MTRSLGSPACNFEVQTPREGATAAEVRAELLSFTEACAPDDTVLCYFSGHGVLEKGDLFLLWDNTDVTRLITTSVAAADILRGLRFCAARNKLLILDCCHAGGIIDSASFKGSPGVPVEATSVQPDNHLVLMASNRFERAREIDDLRGSFMTVNLCRALDSGLEEADIDDDGQLSVMDVTRWLQETARVHNNRNPDRKVPAPYLFGKQEGQFFLTGSDTAKALHEIEIGKSIFLVLPVLSRSGRAVCLGKHPVTNSQYRRLVSKGETTGASEPEGEVFDGEEWVGPFKPWQDKRFNDPGQPVVCVSLDDAATYCEWVTESAKEPFPLRLPSPSEWDVAATGLQGSIRRRKSWLTDLGAVHHQATSTAAVDDSGRRANSYGFCDLFGNVWEWCADEATSRSGSSYGMVTGSVAVVPLLIGLRAAGRYRRVELRGGSYLDDLRRIDAHVDARMLAQGTKTRHSDLGFRMAAEVPLSRLPGDVAMSLTASSAQIGRRMARPDLLITGGDRFSDEI